MADAENKKSNKVRVLWGKIYLIIGLLCLIIVGVTQCPALLEFLQRYYLLILWCCGWAAIGIFAGLMSTRGLNDEGQKKNYHYFTYFIFVLFFAASVAFTFSSKYQFPYSYTAACFIALIIGFSGDSLAGVMNDLSKKFIS